FSAGGLGFPYLPGRCHGNSAPGIPARGGPVFKGRPGNANELPHGPDGRGLLRLWEAAHARLLRFFGSGGESFVRDSRREPLARTAGRSAFRGRVPLLFCCPQASAEAGAASKPTCAPTRFPGLVVA